MQKQINSISSSELLNIVSTKNSAPISSSVSRRISKTVQAITLTLTLALTAIPTLSLANASANATVATSPLSIKPLVTDRQSYNFGRVPVFSMARASYVITNTGATALNFSRADIGGAFFDAYHDCTGGLLPGERCYVDIRYAPQFEGLHSGRFILSFREDSHIVIDLWGEAYRF